MDNRPIGVFDSGVGGLTVVSELMRVLPNEDIIYFGDTARVPYGNKSVETIRRYSSEIVEFLLGKNVKMIIIACGTVSTTSVDYLTEHFSIPFLEMAQPGVEDLLKVTRNNIVGVIGTEATIRSGVHKRLLHSFRPEVSVFTKACPLFVPLVEEGLTNNDLSRMVASHYLKEMFDKKIDSLLLACTHYPLLTESIMAAAADIPLTLVNPALSVAIKAKIALEQNGLQAKSQSPLYKFFISDETPMFEKMCELALGVVL